VRIATIEAPEMDRLRRQESRVELTSALANIETLRDWILEHSSETTREIVASLDVALTLSREFLEGIETYQLQSMGTSRQTFPWNLSCIPKNV
jgi:hypothetical protein